MIYSRLLVLTMALLLGPWTNGQVFAAGQNPTRQWINRPWEIRYMLFVDSAHSMEYIINYAKKANRKPRIGGRTYYLAEAMFETTSTLKTKEDDSVATVLLKFDRDGRIVENEGLLRGFIGKRNELDDLVLLRESDHAAQIFLLAKWSQGIPGDIGFSPAVCNFADVNRYDGEEYSNVESVGSAGCREWTYQLYRRNRPYIDVTTYSELRGNFIGDLVGWSRFTDPPKPVIGLQGKTWLCLHECPDGEKPGVIKDIKAWTAKHGYPMPERPSKQPQFPNADYKDDLNEFAD